MVGYSPELLLFTEPSDHSYDEVEAFALDAPYLIRKKGVVALTLGDFPSLERCRLRDVVNNSLMLKLNS
jgi:hypothetical protein